MSRLWLRNEVFDGVLPLRSTGVPLSPARNHGPGGTVPSPLFVLLKALREANSETVRCVFIGWARHCRTAESVINSSTTVVPLWLQDLQC